MSAGAAVVWAAAGSSSFASGASHSSRRAPANTACKPCSRRAAALGMCTTVSDRHVCVDCVNMCVITSMLLTTNVFVIWTRTVYIDLSTLACKQLASLIVFEVGSMLQSQGACTQVFKGIWWHRVWLIVSRFELCLVLVAVLLPSNHMCVRVQRACI